MGEVPEGPQTCDECDAYWPAFLLLRISLDGCPACNDAWARWPRSASVDDREPERARDGDDTTADRPTLAPSPGAASD